MSNKLPSFIKNKKIGLLGLGQSNLSVYKFLKDKSFEVYLWDDNLTVRESHKHLPLVHPKDWPYHKLDAIVSAPGIPLYFPKEHYIIELANCYRTPIMVDLELFYLWFPNHIYIGVTGTVGKSSYVTLLYNVLKSNNVAVELGGNIGTPIFDLKDLSCNTHIIIEASSFQLSLINTMRFNIAVLLNHYPNHDAYHGGAEGYKKAKQMIFKNSTKKDVVLLNYDQAYTRNLAKKLQCKAICISSSSNRADYFIKQVALYQNKNNACNEHSNREHKLIVDFSTVFSQIGANNTTSGLKTAAFIVVIARILHLNMSKTLKAIGDFKGLEHRQQLVAKYNDKVIFINDSKATTPKAVASALERYNNIYWLVGGIKKSGSLKCCEPFYHKIKKVFVFGPKQQSFTKDFYNKLPFSCYNSLEEAMDAAFKACATDSVNLSAQDYSTVLLSPVGTSFDLFKNFVERGNCFIKKVKELTNATF